jgi:CBS domain-containing protein
VSQILDGKGHDVVTVAPNSTVYDAIKKMENHNIGSVAVVDNGKLVGLFTERHYARRVFLRGKTSPKTIVGEVMALNPVCVIPQQTAEECMSLMTAKRFRHFPVIENNKMVGIISIGDILKSLISDQIFKIEQLVHYIRGD